MKTILTFVFLTVFTLGVTAQLPEIFNFEVGMADTTWESFANGATGTDDDVIMFANPDQTGINTSDSVLMFTVNTGADPWVGMYTEHLAEPMAFTADDHILTMMVYKTIISPCGMKVENSTDGGTNQELMVENTLTDQWELIIFDMSAAIGYTYPRLTVFPDFPASRTEGTYVYLDNITSVISTSVKAQSGKSIKIFPNPVENRMAVQYPDMTGLTISNMLGKTIQSYKFNKTNSKVIELNELSAGIYFISVESGKGNYTSKFMKR